MTTETETRGIALITGGTSGIGAASAKMFAKRGHDLVLTYRKDTEKADNLQRLITSEYGVKVETIAGDLAEESAVDAVLAFVKEKFPGRSVELFLHCAGLYLPNSFGQRLAGGMNYEAYDYYQNIYPKCFVRFVEQILPEMQDGRGRLCALSSAGCNLTHRPRIGYDLPGQAKATLEVISRYYASHLAPRGITCNIVLPGITDTQGWAGVGMDSAAVQAFAEQHSPMKKALAPEDIAYTIDHLMSDRGRYITGMNISVDAGGHLT